jgi:hypothetical protein
MSHPVYQFIMGTNYSYQTLAIDHAEQWLASASPGGKLLLAAPTGTGKSFVLIGLKQRLEAKSLRTIIVTPSPQISIDIAKKIDAISPETEDIYTAFRLKNLALRGDAPIADVLLIDEAHHAEAATWEMLDLCYSCPAIGLTATPYRGTPKSTARFRETWGEPTWIITIPQAISVGAWSLPTCNTVPLVDDDVVKVVDGQFSITSIESATRTRLQDAVELLRPHFDGMTWDRSTMICVPSRSLAGAFAIEADWLGLPIIPVTGDTSPADRRAAFDALRARRVAIVQIAVVSEGVDLPVRRILDLHPMLSPVEWLQQFGRATRPVGPGEPPPEYLCTNRNLLRHAYLLEGCLPPESIRQAEKAFGGPGKRIGLRAVGLECLGRFKGAELPLAGDITGSMFLLSCPDGQTTRQYACLLHPSRADPIWATRSNERTEDPMKPAYGRWHQCDPPADLSGFASVPPSQCTDKMRAWWARDAAKRGLDPEAEVTRKNFAVLPILTDLRMKL